MLSIEKDIEQQSQLSKKFSRDYFSVSLR